MLFKGTTTNLKEKWNMTADVMLGNCKESDIPRYQCVESRSPEEERWMMYDSRHCGISKCRALISPSN